MKNWIKISGACLALSLGLANAADNVLTPEEITDGFKQLFDGTTLKSFNDNFVDYIKNDVSSTTLDGKWKVDATCKCINLVSGNAPDVRSTKIYKDFDLRMSYRIDQNEGIFYRALNTGNLMWETGVEYAINNVTNLGKDNPGAAYDLFAPNPIPYNLFNTNKWNTARIVIKGDSVEHYMNEVKVVGFTYHNARFWDAYNASKWNAESKLTNVKAGDRNSGVIPQGYIGLQGDHTGKWIIKDFRISTTPCFGPMNEFNSSCGTKPVVIGAIATSLTSKFAFRTVSNSGGSLTLAFERDDIKSVKVLGLDGTVHGIASLSDGGRTARFTNAPKTGLYFLKVDFASGSATQKLNLL